jgi:tRNA(Ile)-lysidine synthase
VLLNLVRGSGLDGLAVMPLSPRHPIVALRRSETHALCAAEGLRPVADPTNDDARFRRNRVRHEVLPLLDDVAERDVVPLLCRLADTAVAEVDLLDRAAAKAVPDPTDARAVAGAEPALARRALRAWLREAGGAERHPPDAAAVERVLAVARGDAAACELPGGARVARRGQRLRIDDS